jgi:hypothetical protein
MTETELIPILKTDISDSQNTKIDGTQSLIVSNVDELPLFIKYNKDKYKDWLEKN